MSDKNDVSNIVESAKDDDQVEELDESAAEPDVKEGSVQDSDDDGLDSDVQQIKIQRLEARLESLNSQLDATQDRNERTSEKIGSLRENLKGTQRDVQSAVSSAEKAEELVASVEPNEIDKKISKMKAEVESVRDGLNETEERREQLRTQIRNIKSDLDEIGSLKQVKQLKQDANEMLKTSQKLSNQTKTNADKVEDLYELLQDKAQKIDKLNAGQEELFDKVNNQGDRLQSLELESADKQKQLRKLDSDIDMIKQTFDSPESLDDIKIVTYNSLQSEIEAINTDFNSRLNDLKESGLSQKDLTMLQNEIDRIKENHDSAFEGVEGDGEARLATTADIEAKISDLREDMISTVEFDEKISNISTLPEKISQLNENVSQIQKIIESNNLSEKVGEDELDQRLAELTGRLDTIKEEDISRKVDEHEFNSQVSDLTDRLDTFEAAVSQMENSPFSRRRSWARRFEKTVRHIYQIINKDQESESLETQQLEDEVRQLREQLEAAPTVEEYSNYRQQTKNLVDDLAGIFRELNQENPDDYSNTDTEA